MVTRDLSGEDIVRVLCILKWEHPDGPEVERRPVSVPYHDSVSIGTLHGIADDAGANDLEAFCEWIDSNR